MRGEILVPLKPLEMLKNPLTSGGWNTEMEFGSLLGTVRRRG